VDEVSFSASLSPRCSPKTKTPQSSRPVGGGLRRTARVYTVEDALLPAPTRAGAYLREICPRPHQLLNEWKFGWAMWTAARAGLVLENTYTVPMISHFAIEPFAFMAAVQDGA